MFEKLLEVVLGAKSAAISGVIVVAGAVMTVGGASGVTAVTVEEPPLSPAARTAAAPVPSPLALVEVPTPATQRDAEGEPRAAVGTPDPCEDEADARGEAREKVRSAFATYDAALEQLRAQRAASRLALTLERADAMLGDIAEKADALIAEMAECARPVAERAVAAMETVYNLARGATAATPQPTAKPLIPPGGPVVLPARPTPKATQKPRLTDRPKATPKPTRTPGCDDRVHTSKKQLAATFDTFHSANDKLLAQIRSFASGRVVAAVKAADKVLHTTHDTSRAAIAKAGCADAVRAQTVMSAAGAFERAYLGAKAAASAEAATRR